MTNEHDDVAATLAAQDLETSAPPADVSSQEGDFLEELAALEADLDDTPVSDLSEVLACEKAETEGREFAWPALRGAHVTIAHFTAAIDRKAELEAIYRKRKSKLPSEQLPAKVEERLWEEAMFGTVVKGWRGMVNGGNALVFNLQNYRMAMRLRRFRAFVLSKAREAQNFRDRSGEELSGN